ncbi:MAG: sulfotransferase [Bacteroidota bacterium]
MSRTDAVIITGMHRSGTSLLANILQEAGVDLGTELLGPLPGNPRGHYEDLKFLHFMDEIVQRKGLGILLEEENQISTLQPNEIEYARQLINKRHNVPIWGWKDPRTCLYLDLWEKLLPEAKHIFIYRHPLEVATSLIRRGTDIQILLDPIRGIRSWILHNKFILKFYQGHKESCFLLHVSNLGINVNSTITSISKKLDILLQTKHLGKNYSTNELHLLNPVNNKLFLSALDPDADMLYSSMEQEADLPDVSETEENSETLQVVQTFADMLNLIDPVQKTKSFCSAIFLAWLNVVEPKVATMMTSNRNNILA